MAISNYYRLFDKIAQDAIRKGEKIFIEREALNPLNGLTFVSIAYYKYNGQTIGIIY